MTTWTPRKATEIIIQVQNSKNDFIIVISGFRGVGKSTLEMQITGNLTGQSYFTEEGFRKHNIYSRKELDKKLEELPDKSVLCIDEGINLLFKREFQNKDQNVIIKKFNTYRDKCFVIFLLIPNFWDLDSSIRNSTMVKWWIHCTGYGQGIIYQVEDNEWNPDPWNQKNNFIATRKGVKRYSLPNYVANIIWDELPEDTYGVYKTVKSEKRRLAYEKADAQKLSKKDIVKQILLTNPEASATVLASMLNTPDRYIYEIKEAMRESE